MRAAKFAVAVCMLVACGCGKGMPGGSNSPSQPELPEFIVNHLERVSDGYRDNPATADKRFKGKWGRFPFHGEFVRRGSKTVAHWKRTMMVPDPKQPDIVLHFDNESSVAALKVNHLYTFDAFCEGLVDGEVVFRHTKLVGEGLLIREER